MVSLKKYNQSRLAKTAETFFGGNFGGSSKSMEFRLCLSLPAAKKDRYAEKYAV